MMGNTPSYTGDNTNSISLWQWDGSTSWVKIAECTPDVNFWAVSANTKITSAFASPVTVYPNVLYALGYIYNSSAQPTVPQPYCRVTQTSTFAEFNGSSNPRLTSYIASANTNSPILNSNLTRGTQYLACLIY